MERKVVERYFLVRQVVERNVLGYHKVAAGFVERKKLVGRFLVRQVLVRQVLERREVERKVVERKVMVVGSMGRLTAASP